jgi:FkbM family methyltransferase
MLPYWIRRSKPYRLRQFLIHFWQKRHLNKWEYNGVYLDLQLISQDMRDVISRELYETAEKKLCQEFIHSEDKILEIGSAIGFISLFCRKSLNVSSIYCVEPNPTTQSILERNYELNGFTVNLIKGCLNKCDGEVSMNVNTAFWIDSISNDHDSEFTSSEKIRVKAYSIESILKIINFDPSILIIDVEGAELVLEPSDIPDCVRLVIMEIHPIQCGWTHSFNHLARFINHGFTVMKVIEDVYVMRNSNHKNSGVEHKQKLN